MMNDHCAVCGHTKLEHRSHCTRDIPAGELRFRCPCPLFLSVEEVLA